VVYITKFYTNFGDIKMREQLLSAARAHFASQIEKHRMNVEVMLNNPIAIHDHTDWMTAMEAEIAQIAEFEDKLEVINKYFPK
jgi:hypothetical protein